MVDKDEELAEIDDESLARVQLIAEKKRQLELTAKQVQQSIKASFEQVYEALRTREKQLVRQVEAIHRQQVSLIQSNSELLPSNLHVTFEDEHELVQLLQNYGKLHLSNSIAVNDAEPYKVEEYQEASEDIVNFDKSLKSESQEFDVSSVIRRKRDSSGLHSKNISINLNCASCQAACKLETATASTSKQQQPAESPLSLNTSGNTTPAKENIYSPGASSSNNLDNKSPYKDSPLSPSDPCSSTSSGNLYFKQVLSPKISNCSSGSGSSSDKSALKEIDDDVEIGDKVTAVAVDATKDETSVVEEIDASSSSKSSTIKMQEGEQSEHSVQIQQWLKQILAEPETEPIIHEIGQFTKIPNTRLYREFPVET